MIRLGGGRRFACAWLIPAAVLFGAAVGPTACTKFTVAPDDGGRAGAGGGGGSPAGASGGATQDAALEMAVDRPVVNADAAVDQVDASASEVARVDAGIDVCSGAGGVCGCPATGFKTCPASGACIPSSGCCLGTDCVSGPPNTTGACGQTNACSYACTVPLTTCANSQVSCASWGFESNSVEGWRYQSVDLAPQPAIGASNVHFFGGSFSLGAPVFTTAAVQVPLCGGGVQANLAGKTFHARVFFDTGGATFFSTPAFNDNQVYAFVTSGPLPSSPQSFVTQAFFDPQAGSPAAVPNTWVSLDGPIDNALSNPSVTTQAVFINIGIVLDNPPAAYTQTMHGTIYVDDVQIF